jgi:GNAT superfamily N-acetyltransferase
MTTTAAFGLPRDLGSGLIMRWATPADTEELAGFNLAMHSDNPEEPEEFLVHWTRDLMRGDHPTTKADDFTVVVDTNKGGKIVSSSNLISQTWVYEDIPFPVGRPELVATHPDYRQRGLVREQMAAIHAKSASRGEMVTAIAGIPWYYRQFGYEMGLNLGGSRQLFWARPGNDKKAASEPYRLRQATIEDIPLILELYRRHLGQSLIWRWRDEDLLRYEMTGSHPDSIWTVKPQIVETTGGEAVAYVNVSPWGTGFHLSELGVSRGHSWRAIGLFLVRHLKQEADKLNETREKKITNISFSLGESHPIYEALGDDLEKQIRPYAWYVRVPDIPAFLRMIAPALERRLAGSVLAGHSGTTRINLYRQRFTLVWDHGHLVEVGDNYEYDRLEEGDAVFPDLTFLQLLFGFRSWDELYQSFTDCYTRENETTVLMCILFPKRPSLVMPLG